MEIVNSDLKRFAQDLEAQADAFSDEDVVKHGVINRRLMLRCAAAGLRDAHAQLEQLGAMDLVVSEIGKFVEADDPRAAFAALVGVGAAGATLRPGSVPAEDHADAVARGLEVLRSVPVPEGFSKEPAFEAVLRSKPELAPDDAAELDAAEHAADLDNRARWKHAYHPEALTDEERAHLEANGVKVSPAAGDTPPG